MCVCVCVINHLLGAKRAGGRKGKGTPLVVVVMIAIVEVTRMGVVGIRSYTYPYM